MGNIVGQAKQKPLSAFLVNNFTHQPRYVIDRMLYFCMPHRFAGYDMNKSETLSINKIN
jgi:hypothetical protein